MFDAPLSTPLRVAVTMSVLVYVAQLLVALRRAGTLDAAARRFAAWLVLASAASAVASHVEELRPLLARTFPPAFVIGTGVAASSVLSPSLRARFARFDDVAVRGLLAYRAIFGGLLFGLAALGHLPTSFALAAGGGDLLVGWLALAAPASLAGSAPGRASRLWRGLVHGVGLVDVLLVMGQAMFVVRPWATAHGTTTMMTLPWVFVPSMFALNLHGVVQTLKGSEASRAEPRRDGSEPARGVRRAPS